MLLCDCGHWMVRRYVTDKSGLVCHYYDICTYCEEKQPNGFDGNGNLMHYYIA